MGSQPACWLEVLLHARRVVEENILGGRSAAGEIIVGLLAGLPQWQAAQQFQLRGCHRADQSLRTAPQTDAEPGSNLTVTRTTC